MSVDLANITPDARFFRDLKGSAEDLRHLTFEIQKKLGVSIEPVIGHLTTLCDVNVDNKLNADSLAQIATRLPGWSAPSEPSNGAAVQLADRECGKSWSSWS